ncbi:MAG: hypothetical protein CMH57_11885, partial [Myxococcales bacterium]|nr:hypothetical protein [Myxococcales bacterium]
MKTSTHALVFATALMTLTAALTGCADSEDSTTPVGDVGGESDEFVEALPNDEMLSMSMSSDEVITSEQGLSTVEQGLQPAGLRQHTEDLLRGINGLRQSTQEAIELLTSSVEPVTLTQANTTCKRWEADGERASWQLTSCLKNRQAKHYGYILRGRALDSTSDDDYVAVFAGEGFVLPRHEGRRRGRGVALYDFNNLAALTGASAQGQLGIGYRAAGQMRQLNIGLKEVAGANAEQPLSAAYRFTHAI